MRAARRVALSGVGGARTARGRRLRRGPAAARHPRRPHRSGRLPPGDVHPPRARSRGDARRSRRAPTRRCSRRSTGICASRRPCSPNENSVRFHELDLELHEVLLDFLGFERVKNAVETARGSLDRARLFMCTPQRKAVDLRASMRRSSRRSSATMPTRRSARWKRHLDAVMAELRRFCRPQSGRRGRAARDRGRLIRARRSALIDSVSELEPGSARSSLTAR